MRHCFHGDGECCGRKGTGTRSEGTLNAKAGDSRYTTLRDIVLMSKIMGGAKAWWGPKADDALEKMETEPSASFPFTFSFAFEGFYYLF